MGIRTDLMQWEGKEKGWEGRDLRQGREDNMDYGG